MAQPLTVPEVADHLRINPQTIRKFLRSGRLKGVKVGKSWRIRPEDVEALLAPQEAA